MHGDVVVEQQPQPPQRRGAPAVLQQIGPHLGIGGVDAHVQGRQALGDHPFQVGLGEAGQRGEVPVEERQAVVVVLQVQAAAHALGQLVDEAELAVVVAGPHPVEHRRVDLDAEVPDEGDPLLELAREFGVLFLDAQMIVDPPSTAIACPVMWREASDASSTAAACT